jgi:signal transduction histidine kinase
MAPCQGDAATILKKTADELRLDIVIWNDAGNVIFSASERPYPLPTTSATGWRIRGGSWAYPLGNGTFLGLSERRHSAPRGALFLPLLGGLLLLMALGLLPFSRGITRRLELLTKGAERWGAGDFSHRVPVKGKDEIAVLSERFNQAAAAIEGLIAQERQMLATASHELRTPLARIRLTLDLIAEEPDGARRAERAKQAAEDINDVDKLVEDLLVSARAQPGVPRRTFTEIELFQLVCAEAASVNAEVRGEPMMLQCDQAMVKHMLRNLMINARLYGGKPIRVVVTREAEFVCIAVEDHGPGVPESEQEKIFSPFYRPPGPRPPGDTGCGLGLALVRQVARYHDGDVTYRPVEPTGSRFEVRLRAR